MQHDIQRAKELIEQSEAVLICAGAGMGVDSGLPDFRGNEGFWKAYPPIKRLGLSFSEMANPRWFEKDPHLAWGFYGHRLQLYRQTKPHRGFELLRRLTAEKGNNYFIFTSNVDGQFQKAGFDQEHICEIHGSIHFLQCTQPCSEDIWKNEENVEVDIETLRAKRLPQCRHCKRIARPNILMFGDWSFVQNRVNAQLERLQAFLKKNSIAKTVVIEMGAGEAVPTVRRFSEEMAMQENVTLIRINPRESDVPPGNISIAAGAKEALEAVLEGL